MGGSSQPVQAHRLFLKIGLGLSWSKIHWAGNFEASPSLKQCFSYKIYKSDRVYWILACYELVWPAWNPIRSSFIEPNSTRRAGPILAHLNQIYDWSLSSIMNNIMNGNVWDQAGSDSYGSLPFGQTCRLYIRLKLGCEAQTHVLFLYYLLIIVLTIILSNVWRPYGSGTCSPCC